jgi:hypothetical protein
MKGCIVVIMFITIASFCACDEIGGTEAKHPIPSSAKFLLAEGDTLVYSSGSQIEKYTIAVLVNGTYSEYRSGTCGKGARDIIDFQAIYIKSVDSLKVPYRPGEEIDDCDGPPGSDTRFISIIKNLVNTFQSQGITYDGRLTWYNDFSELESNSTAYHDSIVLNNQGYKDVYEFKILGNSNTMFSMFYYNKHYGFVGYKRQNGTLFNLIEPVVN